AMAMRDQTAARTMPPWGVGTNGTCGTFANPLTLDQIDIDSFSGWIVDGLREGTPRTIPPPSRPALEAAIDFFTPTFAPAIQESTPAQLDEYRCFSLDAGVTDATFITGYDVHPGTPEIVRHVMAFVVDPDAPARPLGKTNAQIMEDLHAQSPDRDGWP